MKDYISELTRMNKSPIKVFEYVSSEVLKFSDVYELELSYS